MASIRIIAPGGFDDMNWLNDPMPGIQKRDHETAEFLALDQRRKEEPVHVTRTQLAEAILTLLDE